MIEAILRQVGPYGSARAPRRHPLGAHPRMDARARPTLRSRPLPGAPRGASTQRRRAAPARPRARRGAGRARRNPLRRRSPAGDGLPAPVPRRAGHGGGHAAQPLVRHPRRSGAAPGRLHRDLRRPLRGLPRRSQRERSSTRFAPGGRDRPALALARALRSTTTPTRRASPSACEAPLRGRRGARTSRRCSPARAPPRGCHDARTARRRARARHGTHGSLRPRVRVARLAGRGLAARVSLRRRDGHLGARELPRRARARRGARRARAPWAARPRTGGSRRSTTWPFARCSDGSSPARPGAPRS